MNWKLGTLAVLLAACSMCLFVGCEQKKGAEEPTANSTE